MNALNGSTVELIDHMGSDQRVVDAARVSTGKTSDDPERDRKLIHYLWSNEHQTPMEKIVFEFKVSTPIFVARQIFRHRIGSFNEQSGRYRELPMDFFIPDTFRSQNKTGNKQGSYVDPDLAQRQARWMVEIAYGAAEESYQEMLRMGVANELARIVLPVGIYTSFFWTINARSLFNFLHLRLDSHAQPEIQEVAQKMAALVKPLIPWTYEAFEASQDTDE